VRLCIEEEQQTVQPISHPKSLMEVTADRIRDSIISGELPLGSKLSEQRLADTLGVSRSPVRDALAALQVEGLVNISPKRGSFVFTPDLRDVDELCEYRAMIETAALRKGIARNHIALMEALDAAMNTMETALKSDDTHSYTAGDLQFHKAIVVSCQNRAIIAAYRTSTSPIKALRTHLFTFLNARMDQSMAEHTAITNACRVKDADTAAARLEQHVGHLVEEFRAATDLAAAQKEKKVAR